MGDKLASVCISMEEYNWRTWKPKAWKPRNEIYDDSDDEDPGDDDDPDGDIFIIFIYVLFIRIRLWCIWIYSDTSVHGNGR